MHNQATENLRQDFDQELQTIADYVLDKHTFSADAYLTAHHCLLDAMGCAMYALQFKPCRDFLGFPVGDMSIKNGARVPGTAYELDPVTAALNIGAMIRWLDYNDTWLAAEWGHPSDNLGAILAVADYLNRRQLAKLTVADILTCLIKAYEIQGIIALQNSFNRIGFDHVVLVKLASTAVATWMLGGTREQILNALSLALVDGQSMRTYRHAPNTSARKSWAAGDATSRAVWLALQSMRGEQGLPSVLTAEKFGFYDVYFAGKPFVIEHAYTSYVVENILFKVAYPAEFHAQTAVECAVQCHKQYAHLFIDVAQAEQIEKIVIHTQEPAVRIISKVGPLYNSADRDHCLQYMVAAALIFGTLTAEHYSDDAAADVRIDHLRQKMTVVENLEFTRAYYDPAQRAIPNALQLFFKNGDVSEQFSLAYPLGHRMRRMEAYPLLREKFKTHVGAQFSAQQLRPLLDLWDQPAQFKQLLVDQWISLWLKPEKS